MPNKTDIFTEDIETSVDITAAETNNNTAVESTKTDDNTAETNNNTAVDDINADLIFENSDIKEDIYLLKRNKANLFPLQNLSILKAQMKSGKTFVASLFASAFLADSWEHDEIIANNNENVKTFGNVLYIDTEQSPAASLRIRKRITKLFALENYAKENVRSVSTEDYNQAAEVLENRLFIANLRKYDTAVRLQKIGAMLKQLSGLKFVVIDGIKDICTDFNDISEVANTMNTVTNWALDYNLHILCILHENPGSDKARGHLGTELYNKATEIINVKREVEGVNNFAVTWEAIRDGSGVDKLNFMIEDFGEDKIAVPRLLNVVASDNTTSSKTESKTTKQQKPTSKQKSTTTNPQFPEMIF